jgi:glutamyl/glutaminyl-tRNA synthetase
MQQRGKDRNGGKEGTISHFSVLAHLLFNLCYALRTSLANADKLMEPITALIVAGLIIAGTAAVNKFTEKAVEDSYDALKRSISDKVDQKYLQPLDDKKVLETGEISKARKKLAVAIELEDLAQDQEVVSNAKQLFNVLQNLDLPNRAPQEIKDNSEFNELAKEYKNAGEQLSREEKEETGQTIKIQFDNKSKLGEYVIGVMTGNNAIGYDFRGNEK